ncbi:hypothetical protein [Cereibacter changlensis]|nr:hypothetical protein [Cereibacter changlensis]PZX57342.1 hypothetical protein LX76_00884 [Cereibacter changlensis]
MTLTTSAIVGDVPLPSGAAPAGAELMFTLSCWDSEGDHCLPPATIMVPLGEDGALPEGFRLWRTTKGRRGAHYKVALRWSEGQPEQKKSTDLGAIQIGDADEYALADLLAGSVPAAPQSFWVRRDSMAEIDAAVAGVERMANDLRAEAQEPFTAPVSSEGAALLMDANGNALLGLRSTGLDYVPSRDLVARYAAALGVEVGYSATRVQIIPVDGQSLSVGGEFTGATVTRAGVENFDTTGALELYGLKLANGNPIGLRGPLSRGWDMTALPTGIGPARPHSRHITTGYVIGSVRNRYRAAAGLPLIPALVGSLGVPGAFIEALDKDSQVTDRGVAGDLIWRNKLWWHDQAKRLLAGKAYEIPWLVWLHGTSSGKAGDAAGHYLGKMRAYFDDFRAMLAAKGITGLARVILMQDAADTDTSALPWHVVDEHLQFCEEGSAVLAGPLYPYEVWDDNVHPSADQTILFGEVIAWAMAEVEAGRQWTIRRPVASISGNVLSLHYASLREDEVLTAHDAAKYGGVGISNLGFEMEGATITGVSVAGHTIRIGFSGTPTQVRYAHQRRNATGAGNKFTAHRGLLRTSLSRTAEMLPDQRIHRWSPSYIINL